MAVALTFNEFARRARQASGTGLLASPLPAGIGQAMGQILLTATKRRFQTSTGPDGTPWKKLAHPRIRGGGLPLLDTGILRNSITAQAEPYGASIGTAVPYARLHQFGGEIKPRKGKALTIPLTKEAQRAGSVARLEATLGRRLFRPKGKRTLCDARPASRNGGKPTVTPHFLLVKSVKVPARPFLGVSPAEMEQFELLAQEMASGRLADLLRDGKGGGV